MPEEISISGNSYVVSDDWCYFKNESISYIRYDISIKKEIQQEGEPL
jgi:hypothetical protein